MAIPNAQKRLKIRRVVKNGELVLASDEQPLPKFRDEAEFDILIDATYVTDTSRLNEIEGESAVPFLPKGTRLLAQVNADNVPDDLRRFLHREPSLIDGYAVVEFTLHEDVDLRFRAGRDASLYDVKCFIEPLTYINDNPYAKSINHAYTLITRHFEPHRISTGGNVFNKVFYQSSDADYWVPLRYLRDEIQQRQIETANKSDNE